MIESYIITGMTIKKQPHAEHLAVAYSLIVALMMLLGILVIALPPNIPMSGSVALVLGLVLSWIAAVTLFRQALATSRLSCCKLYYIRILTNGFTLIYWCVYLYIVIWRPMNTCSKLIQIADTIEMVACPNGMPKGSCVKAEFELHASRTCTRSRVIMGSSQFSMVNDASINRSSTVEIEKNITIESGPNGIHIWWVNQTSDIPMVLGGVSLLCGEISRPICLIPSALPPFFRRNDDMVFITNSTTWTEVSDFLKGFVMAGFLGLVYLGMALFRFVKKRVRNCSM